MTADNSSTWSDERARAKSAVLADYFTRQELADELGVTTRSLERWAWLRSGPKRTHIGNRVYYHRAAVEQWLANRTEASV